MIVVDENDNKIGMTYKKRAKGLIKKGRARFIDENKICLFAPRVSPCPPSIDLTNLEDNKMDEKIIINQSSESKMAEEIYSNEEGKLTEREIFEELKLMREAITDSSSLASVLETVTAVSRYDSDMEYDVNDAINESLATIRDINNRREDTIIKLLDLYQDIFNRVNG